MLLSDFINYPITDIISTGIVSIENRSAEFLPDLRILHFEIAGKYVVFESIKQFSEIKISVSEKLRYYDVDDEDMLKSYMSIANIILWDIYDRGNKTAEIYLYDQKSKDNKSIICDAVKINLLNGQTIFLDPKYYFGINIGGSDQEKRWFDNLDKDERKNVQIKIITADDVYISKLGSDF